MTKSTKIMMVAAIVIAAMVTLVIWHHYRKPDASKVVQASLAETFPPSADDAKYSAMTADQAARTFFEAFGREDWNEVTKFWPQGPEVAPLNDRVKSILGGLEIVSLGKPSADPMHDGSFVPYEIRFKGGGSKQGNLRLVKPNPAGRWYLMGGL